VFQSVALPGLPRPVSNDREVAQPRLAPRFATCSRHRKAPGASDPHYLCRVSKHAHTRAKKRRTRRVNQESHSQGQGRGPQERAARHSSTSFEIGWRIASRVSQHTRQESRWATLLGYTILNCQTTADVCKQHSCFCCRSACLRVANAFALSGTCGRSLIAVLSDTLQCVQVIKARQHRPDKRKQAPWKLAIDDETLQQGMTSSRFLAIAGDLSGISRQHVQRPLWSHTVASRDVSHHPGRSGIAKSLDSYCGAGCWPTMFMRAFEAGWSL
jgi:hypothetical protein